MIPIEKIKEILNSSSALAVVQSLEQLVRDIDDQGV